MYDENDPLSEFTRLIQEGKKAKKEEVRLAKEKKKNEFFEKYNIENSINPLGFLSELAKLKKEVEVVEEEPIVEEVNSKEEVLSEISELVDEVTLQETDPAVITEPVDPLISKAVNSITKVAETTSVFTVPAVDKPQPNFKALQNKLEYLEKWVYKISAEGPGSGSYWLNDLGDTDHRSVKNASNNQVLTFDSSIGKWVASSIQPSEIVNNTTEVTSNSYTVTDSDYYIGVNVPEPATITIPDSLNQGRIIIVKDESGNCYNNPITLSGKIDNDVTGATIKINNGAVQLIFRSGFWRII
jgi:hypothetical protein